MVKNHRKSLFSNQESKNLNIVSLDSKINLSCHWKFIKPREGQKKYNSRNVKTEFSPIFSQTLAFFTFVFSLIKFFNGDSKFRSMINADFFMLSLTIEC